MVYDGYVVDLEDEDVLLLQITDPVSINSCNCHYSRKIDEIRVNLKPILINIEKKLGKQLFWTMIICP